MIIELSNGNEVILDDIVKDPKAEAIRWLREYNERRTAIKPQIEEMTAAQCYDELDRLAERRRTAGRGRNPAAYQARHYCRETRKAIKRRLQQLGAPLTRLDDGRIYGPGATSWQRSGG